MVFSQTIAACWLLISMSFPLGKKVNQWFLNLQANIFQQQLKATYGTPLEEHSFDGLSEDVAFSL